MSSFWHSLEEIAGPAAVRAEWMRWVGPSFKIINANFLLCGKERALVVPCPKSCGCDHDIVEHDDGTLVGVCTCDPWKCENIALKPEDVEVWELDWERLGRAVAKAFRCEPRDGEFIAPGSVEIGVLASGLPVVLTIQQSRDEFRSAIGMIVARLREDFAVLAPTARFFDASCHGALRSAKARIVALESNVEFGPDGGLVSDVSLQSLFSGRASEGADTVAVSPLAAPAPRYVLRKGLGLWQLIFDGQPAAIDFGRGISLVAYLLFNPPAGGLHGTELDSLVFGNAVVEAANVMAEGDSTKLLIQKEARECQRVLQNPSASEMERDEAREKLERLAKALNVVGRTTDKNADNQVRAVKKAIKRLIDDLRESTDRNKNPNAVLRAFAEHLHNHLWIPSSRFSGTRHGRTRTKTAGRLTYEPPEGVVWTE
jgi:hypothetical protein